MNRILVGIDFSAPSRTALAKAVDLSTGHRGKILALHVVENAMIDSLVEHTHLERPEIIDNLELRLSRFAAELSATDSIIETRVVVGHPVKDFGTTADEFDPDLVVLGAWGSHGSSKKSAGFTAKQVVQECRCDAVLVRESAQNSRGVVACVDFSAYDKSVVAAAEQLRQQFFIPLEIIHVFYPSWKIDKFVEKHQEIFDSDFTQEYKAILQGKLDNLIPVFEIGSSDVKTTVIECLRHSDGILAHLRKTEPEIVVIGARGSSRIESMILGRIAERIVTESEASVYLVKEPG